MNFCITDGISVVATRYVSSKSEEAASLVSSSATGKPASNQLIFSISQWFSSGTTFSEYAPGGHYRMTKSDKRENIIMVASEPLTFEEGELYMSPYLDESCLIILISTSRLDGNPHEYDVCDYTQDERSTVSYCG
jgi:predicted glutamine amidotransferase